MSQAVERYLDRVMACAKLRDSHQAARVRAELTDHLHEKIEGLVGAGMAREDAVFQAIEDHGSPRVVGYGLRPKFPWLDVRCHGTARGVIAIGPKAVGVFAFGGAAVGVVAIGGFSLGILSMGGFVLSLLFGWGGVTVVPTGLAYGGVAIGLVAVGGAAVGAVAAGGWAAALWVSQAATGLSYYTADTVPLWLKNLPPLMPLKSSGSLTLAALAIFFPVFAGGFITQMREHRRLRRCDRTLVE